MHELVIIIAKYFLLLSLLISFVVWLRLSTREKKEFILLVVIGGIIALLLAKLGGKLFYDTRPFIAGHFTPYFSHGADNGFPSDHTLLTSLLAFVVLKYQRREGYILLGVAVLVGVARVIAGVHHLTDIVGSIVFSGAAVYITLKIIQSLQNRRPKTS